MFDSNFDMLSPTAWNAELLANDYPRRPALNAAKTSIDGINISGQFASRNQKIKVHKAEKFDGDARTYAGNNNYTIDPIKFTESEIEMTDIYYRTVEIDKWDQNFALPDLVRTKVVPIINNIADTVNKNHAKKELAKAATVVGLDNTGYTVTDDTDLRFVRKLLLEEQDVADNPLMAVIDPTAQFDLTGLSLFQEAQKRGSNSIQLSGSMGVYDNINFFLDNRSYTPSNEGAVGNAVVSAAKAVGEKVIAIDNGNGAASNCSLVAGDTITFGTAKGRSDHYVIQSVADDKLSITLYQGLRTAIANNATINAVSTGNAQFIYDPDSLVIVSAIPAVSAVRDVSGTTRVPFFEPNSGLNFMITYEGNTGGGKVTVETLIGSKNFYPTRTAMYLSGLNAKP